jgi:hypothetical protein
MKSRTQTRMFFATAKLNLTCFYEDSLKSWCWLCGYRSLLQEKEIEVHCETVYHCSPVPTTIRSSPISLSIVTRTIGEIIISHWGIDQTEVHEQAEWNWWHKKDFKVYVLMESAFARILQQNWAKKSCVIIQIDKIIRYIAPEKEHELFASLLLLCPKKLHTALEMGKLVENIRFHINRPKKRDWTWGQLTPFIIATNVGNQYHLHRFG